MEERRKTKWKILVLTNTGKITTVCSKKDDVVTLLKAALRLLRAEPPKCFTISQAI